MKCSVFDVHHIMPEEVIVNECIYFIFYCYSHCHQYLLIKTPSLITSRDNMFYTTSVSSIQIRSAVHFCPVLKITFLHHPVLASRTVEQGVRKRTV
jgi:hypothetical protein